MSSPATYMRSRIKYQLTNDFGISNIDESDNYWMKFDYKGHHFEFNVATSWWNMDNGEKHRGNQEMLNQMRKL